SAATAFGRLLRISSSSNRDCRCRLESSTKSRSINRRKPTPARTIWSAVTVPRAPKPTTRTRASVSRCWPPSPIGANRIWREYRSSGGKSFQLPFDGFVNSVHDRLRFYSDSLSNNRGELARVFRQNEKGRKARLPQNDIARHDCNSEIPGIKRPNICDSCEHEGRSLDGMNFRNTLSREPFEKIIQGPIDEFRIRTILPTKQRLDCTLPECAAEDHGMDLQQTRLRNLLNRFTSAADIGTAFELLNQVIGFFPSGGRVDSLQTLKVGKLQSCAEHRFGINW